LSSSSWLLFKDRLKEKTRIGPSLTTGMQTNLQFKVAAVLHILLTGFAVPSVRLSPDKTTLNVELHRSVALWCYSKGILIMICCNAEAK
jgi:hypothetical protein